MIKKILKAILAVLAVVTAFICGAYVQGSTGRQMPVMAQRKNAMTPDTLNRVLDFNIDELPSLFHSNNDSYPGEYAYANITVDLHHSGDYEVSVVEDGLYYDNPMNTGIDIVWDYIEGGNDLANGFIYLDFNMSDYLDYYLLSSNNTNDSTLFYFYIGQLVPLGNFIDFEFLEIDLKSVEILYKDNSKSLIFNNYNEYYPFFNNITKIESFEIIFEYEYQLPIDFEVDYVKTDFRFCPVRVQEWFDSLALVEEDSYNLGYSVGYNEGYSNGVAASSDPYYDLTNAKFDLGMLDNNNDFYYVFRNRDIELVNEYYDFTQYVFNALSEYHSEGYESEYIELELYDFKYFSGAAFEINVQGFTKIYISYDRNDTEVVNIGDPSSLETIELRSEGLVTDFTLLVDPNYTNQQTYKLGFNYLNTYENGYESGYRTGLNNGRNEVINDPNKYNLYNATQYNNYGKAQYQTGYNEGIRQDAPTGLEWFKSAISVTNAFLDIQILPGVKLIHICGGFIILGLLRWILDWFRG